MIPGRGMVRYQIIVCMGRQIGSEVSCHGCPATAIAVSAFAPLSTYRQAREEVLRRLRTDTSIGVVVRVGAWMVFAMGCEVAWVTLITTR